MESSPPPATSQQAEPKHVLVVDDIPEICNMYRAVFRRVRAPEVALEVETDPEEAIRKIRMGHYDLVVSDFRMRGSDGVDVLTAAREHYPDGRRVLMTGYNEIPTSIDRIRSARIDAYLQKPLKTQDLLIMMNDLLRNDKEAVAAYRAQAEELEQVALREEHPLNPRRMNASGGD